VHDKCMAVKTITIDMEAYEVLARRKKPGQSFSQVIKEQIGRRKTAGDLLRIAAELRMAPETLDAVDAQIKARGRSRARSPRF
jgi:predicted CopG family antitoxin